MSTSVYYKDAKLIDVNNNTKTLLTAGKYLEDDVILTDVTVHQTHTVTITGQGNIYQGYIEYNNVKYYSSGDVINVSDGDTITIYLGNGYTNYLSINGVRVAGGYSQTVDYTYSVTFDAEIKFSLLTGQSDVYLTESDIQALSVIENGTYTASGTTRGYSPVKVNVPNPSTSSLTVTPTESQQTFNATGVYGYKPVTVNGISSTYVGTGVAKKSSADTTFASTTGTFTAPVGYYSTAATKTITTQAAQTIYPSTATQYVNSYRWLTGSQTIASVTTSNLIAENIAEGVTVKVGDANNASRITQVTGTHKGGGGHDAVLLNAGTYNERLPQYTYVSYNGTRYYTNEDTFNFNEGDTIQTIIYGTNSSNVYLNNTLIGSGMNVSFSAPSYPLTVYFSVNGIYFNKAYPSGTLNITSNGTYNVYGYSSANISVSTTPSEQYYKATLMNYGATNFRNYIRYNNKNYYQSGSTFYFKAGDTISYYGESITGSYVYSDGTRIYSSTAMVWGYNYTAPAHPLNIMFSSGVCFNSPTISIDSNGIYDVTDYASASVNVSGGGGFTTDEIAMRTISGDISGSATSVANYAFYLCSKLTTASFPNATSIGVYAFRYCSALTTASFPNATSIYSYAFANCSALTIADFPNVVNIYSSAFYDCRSLTTASFPSATSVGTYAFYSCYALTTVSFPNVTSIGNYTFYDCSALTTLSFPSATSVGTCAFQYCSALTTVSFPNATHIGNYAFNSCYSLTTVSFPNVTSIGSYTFYDCSALTTLSFPSATRIGSSAFYYCTKLTTASFPKVTSIMNYAFMNCFNLLSFYLLGSSVPTLGTSVFYSTPIGGYTTSTGGVYGSIFVPSSLYNSYITATNWSLYSSRFASINNFTINYNGQTFDYYFEDGMTFSTFISTNYNNKYKPSYYFKSTYTSEVDFVDDSEGDMWAWAVRQNGASVYGTSSIINNGIYSAR